MAYQIPDILGILSGGRGQVDAAALSAKAGLLVGQTRNKILDNLRAYGKKLGPTIGPDFIQAISEGATPAAANARKERELELFGTSRQDLMQYGLWLAGGIILLAFVWRNGGYRGS